MTTLRWLHITDLHTGMKDQGLWPSAAQSLLEDLEQVTRRVGPVDIVLFTGDLAFSGKHNEYRHVDRALAQIWEVLQRVHPFAPEPKLLAVPGNHDLDRPGKTDATAYGLLTDPRQRDDLWRGGRDKLRPLRGWFKGYEKWWKDCKRRPTTGLAEGLLPGEFSYTLEKDDARFGFAGMNSAFLDTSDEVKEGQLWVDVRQIQPACGSDLPAWRKRHHLTFLLTHHPPSWLSKESRDAYAASIAPFFTAHLCGHLHESFAEMRRVGGGDARRMWQATSLFGIEKLPPDGKLDRKHGYTLGEIDLRDGQAHSRLWPRLAVRLQDRSWRVTVDYTYRLADDLCPTRPEELPVQQPLPVPPPSTAAPAIASPAEPATWRQAIERAALWPASGGETAERLRLLAVELADTCWAWWQRGEAAVPGDPWRDDRYPVRVVQRLEQLVRTDAVRPEEVVLVLVAPFLREAAFAAGAAWMAPARPDDLAVEGEARTADAAHAALEQLRHSRPDLVRHATRLAGDDRRSVCLWMMIRALQASSDLWRRTPGGPAYPLLEQIVRIVDDHGAARWLRIEMLLRLARCVGVNPDALDGEEGIEREGEVTLDGIHLRIPALGYLLCAAGWQALDVRTADEVVVDHVGRDGFKATEIREALRAARWTARDERHLLERACTSPVVDFALKDLVRRADEALERIRRKHDRDQQAFALLQDLPSRLSGEGIQPATNAHGRALYRLPHVRFRLDHNRIRELLMGEALYGDPTLAIRELYQNALDACRYRKARAEYLKRIGKPAGSAPYEGRITFRQSTDAAGRRYIECEDNGVGMTEEVVERVFAVAGQRFHDTPDFIEEQAAWQQLPEPVELHRNSQFGIGVLSYFMLADELVIYTRRYHPDGRWSSPLVVRIASASGLFRLEHGREEDMPEPGTRVRLYLTSTTYSKRSELGMSQYKQELSCGEVLGELLWVAEVDTRVEEKDRASLRWPIGVPARNVREIPRARCLPTTDPDIWWLAPEHAGRNFNIGVRVLVDGLSTSSSPASCMLVNLRGQRPPKLTADRRTVHSWDHARAIEVAEKDWHVLPEWEGLTFGFLWALESISLNVARAVCTALLRQGRYLRLDGPNQSGAEIQKTGSCAEDDDIVHFMRFESPNPSNVNLLEAWRVACWAKAGAVSIPLSWPAHMLQLADLPIPAPEPGDQLFLGNQLWGRTGMFERGGGLVRHLLSIARIAAMQRMSVAEVLARARGYAPLGIVVEPSNVDPSLFESLSLDDNDWKLLSRELDGQPPWVRGKVPPGQLLKAVKVLEMLPEEIVQRLRRLAPLGVHVEISPESLRDMNPTDEDLRLLSRNDDASYPWLRGEVGLDRVLTTAESMRLPAAEAARRLTRFEVLGIKLAFAPSALEGIDVSEEQRVILSWNLNAGTPYISHVSTVRVLLAAHKLGVQPSDVLRHLQGLPGLSLDVPEGAALDDITLTDDDLRLVSWNLSGEQPWNTVPVGLSHILTAARRLDQPIAKIAASAHRIGLLSESTRVAVERMDGRELDETDERLLDYASAASAAGGQDEITRKKVVARFWLWWLPSEEFEARWERLLPLLQQEWE
ncbi:wHTH domain-containing protein [Sorangium sp. So ce362]|uniref:wHTH domain-containing protein n=1 Tax=Sorangium sp. So ce362 TaxID=3133303 RepID=UPI003F5EB69B